MCQVILANVINCTAHQGGQETYEWIRTGLTLAPHGWRLQAAVFNSSLSAVHCLEIYNLMCEILSSSKLIQPTKINVVY